MNVLLKKNAKMPHISRKIFDLMKALKQRGIVNSSEACPVAELPLVYRILPSKFIHAVPLKSEPNSELLGRHSHKSCVDFFVFTPEDFPLHSI